MSPYDVKDCFSPDANINGYPICIYSTLRIFRKAIVETRYRVPLRKYKKWYRVRKDTRYH